MLSFFPRGVLDEILNLIESVSEEFPSYSWIPVKVGVLSIVSVLFCISHRNWEPVIALDMSY